MSPQEFVAKWQMVTTSERATAQSHFLDLCELLGEPKPHDADPDGEWFAFEKGAEKTGGGDGWADVWKRNAFAWEYKGKHSDLEKALAQVKQYAAALQNPPLLVACDINRTIVQTNWTNTVTVRYEVKLEELVDPKKRELLKQVFRGDERLRTGETRAALTSKVAREFASLAQELQSEGKDPLEVAHFVNRLVFCMFAEDAGLLGDSLFSRMLEAARRIPGEFVPLAEDLFRAMKTGGRIGFQNVEWFNGGLFNNDAALALTRSRIDRIRQAATRDWSAIDPSLLGTLFERGLDPSKRSQLGAHYTDSDNIMRIVEPVVLRPLSQEWDEAKALIIGYRSPARKREVFNRYLSRLRGITVLDPACGSGNFLYVTLRALKDLEHRVLLEGEALGLARQFPQIGPEVLRGIELNLYAAELARVSIWIGELQWQIEHGFNVGRNPILKPLEAIENRDALLGDNGEVAEWPDAEFIIGNPPFLGGKLLRRELGSEYVERLFAAYDGDVPREADLCAYWFEKARLQIEHKAARRAGLIATQGIRGGSNRKVLEAIKETGDIFLAWSDLPWVLEGANVHVSIVGFGDREEGIRILDGLEVPTINSNLTSKTDVNTALLLPSNQGFCYMGDTKGGRFDIDEALARNWLESPNPHGRPNSDVLVPWLNGSDVNGSDRHMWIIDFGSEMSEQEASLYELPFAWVKEYVFPPRQDNNREVYRRLWWRHIEARPALTRAIRELPRFIVVTRHSKHLVFSFASDRLPDSALIVFAKDDDYTFGVLQSRYHELWARAQGTQLRERESGFRYTPTTCFETFPFPDPTDIQYSKIVTHARELNEFRSNWLDPPQWTQEDTLVFPATAGGPWQRWIVNADSIPVGTVGVAHFVRRVPKPGARRLTLARTLTRLYNEGPAWLRNAHERLNISVAEAYGWSPDDSDSEVIESLLALNQARAASKRVLGSLRQNIEIYSSLEEGQEDS